MLIIIILLIVLSLSVIFADNKEQFGGGYLLPWATRINRPTRNMSYDLRGEAYYPPLLNLPFDNSSIAPIPQPEFADRQGICV
jgi:hypothetical protein